MGRIKSVFILCASIAMKFVPGATALAGDTRAITLDNDFSDWSGAVALATDPSGDVAGGEADFTQVFVADDNERLYFRFDTTRELVLLESNPAIAGNDLRIFIDGDGSAATGMLIDGVGVDLEVHIGSRQAFYYSGGTTTTLSLNEIGFAGIPTHSGFEFEVQVPFSITPGFGSPVSVITGPTVNIFIREDGGGDRVPDSGTMTYTLDGTPVAAPAVTSFSKVNASDIRLFVHNVLNSGPEDVGREPAFTRVLQSLDPDIVCFTEWYTSTISGVESYMETILPAGPGEAWNAQKNNDAVTVSLWPIVNFANVDGNLLCEIDPPADRSFRNLIIFNAHTPCCTNNAGRDVEHDRISSTWRNLLNGVGPFTIDVTSPVFMVGDFNMVGFVRQLETLRDGTIIDNGTFGADFSPGRTNGSLVSAPVRHSHTRSTYSWRNDGSSFSVGKLDYILFSDDEATLQRNFTLWTPDMDSGSLTAAGLLSTDSTTMSDHLVMVADFSLSLVPVEISRFEID